MEFFEFTGQTRLGGGIHAINKESSVQVVELVLQGAGEEAGGDKVEFPAIEMIGADSDRRGPADGGLDFWKAEAAFGAGDFPRGLAEDRVKQDQGHPLVEVLRLPVDEEFRRLFTGADIHYSQLNRATHLLRGQAHAVGDVHGLDHVGSKLLQLGGDAVDALAFFAEHGVPKFDDFQNHCPQYSREVSSSQVVKFVLGNRFMPLMIYLDRLLRLLVVPFDHLGTAWPILPVYTTLILGELYKSKIGFSHAVGNGFVMLWTGLNWARHLSRVSKLSYLFDARVLAWVVAAAVIGLGLFTILLGFRRKDKALCELLGHTRFSCYFLITFYPMQAGLVRWEWSTLAAILIWAIPSWVLIYVMGRVAAKWVG